MRERERDTRDADRKAQTQTDRNRSSVRQADSTCSYLNMERHIEADLERERGMLNSAEFGRGGGGGKKIYRTIMQKRTDKT